MVLVVNPISGDIDKAELLDLVLEFCEANKISIHLYETTGKNDIEQLQTIYEEYKPDRIVVAGGDGTIKMVAEAMEAHDIIIGILPAGSANGLAVDLSLPTTIGENLKIAFQNQHIEVDMIAINGKKAFI